MIHTQKLIPHWGTITIQRLFRQPVQIMDPSLRPVKYAEIPVQKFSKRSGTILKPKPPLPPAPKQVKPNILAKNAAEVISIELKKQATDIRKPW